MSERFCQDRSELAGRLDPIAPGAEGVGELDKVGIAEGDPGLSPEVHSLLPLDQVVGGAVAQVAINQEEAKRSLCPPPADSR